MPFCTFCGNQISDAAPACPKCGHPAGVGITGRPVGRRTEGLAVASLALGIGGFTVCPLICSIIAVILGTQARRRIHQDPTLEGDAMARAGIILGWVGIGVVGLAILAFVLVAIFAPDTFHPGQNIHVMQSPTV
jgi:hypothetical protein